MGWLDDIGDFIGPAIGGIGDFLGGAGKQIGDFAGDALKGIGEAGPGGASIGDLAGIDKAVGGGGGGDWWSSLLQGVGENAGKSWGGVKEGWKDFSGFAKDALPFASLGAAGLGAASSIKGAQQAAEQNKILKHSQELQEKAATPLTDFGRNALATAQAGNVPPAVQTQIDQWAQGARQQVRDYLARAGIPESSARVMEEQWINQTAQAMKSQWIQSQEQLGVSALSAGANAAGNLGHGAQQEQGGIEALIKQANEALGKMAGAAA